MKTSLIILSLLFTLSFDGVIAEETKVKSSLFLSTSIYYYNNTPGNLYISLYNVASSTNVGSWNVPPGSGYLVSVPDGTYHSYMGGNGGTYTFSINGQSASGTGHSFHNVYLSGSSTFSAN